MPKSTRRPTVRDVARAAGVSAQSVSRVINNQPGVSDHTRTHIQQVIQQLDYRPNKAAQALSAQRTHLIEVIAIDVELPLRRALNQAARQFGYHIMFSYSELTAAQMIQAFGNAEARLVDGLILAPSMMEIELPDTQLVELTHGIPFVQVATRIGQRLPSVVCDQHYGAALAVRHLIELGHRQIAIISGPPRIYDAVARYETWQNTLAQEGLEPGPGAFGDFTAQSGYHAAHELLDSGRDFTAVFAGNDLMALGAIHAFSERGLRVPDDISVVGFDDIAEAAFYHPPLTTVFQDWTTMGRLAVEYLVSLIEKPDTPKYQRVLTPDLVVRQSTRRL